MQDGPATLAVPDDGAGALAVPFADPLPKWFAAFQVVLVSGIPTQLVLFGLAVLYFGFEWVLANARTLKFMAVAGFVDTAFIALLLRFFLSLSGETSSQVFIGRRPVKRELLLGLAFMPVVFLGVAGVVLALRAIAPSLHNVQVSPLEPYVTTPFDAAIFFVVVVLVGGVREELQRAFILHRFRQRLGGANLGLTLFSVLFAALHYDQGIDVAIAVGLLGLLWGVLYLKRGSAMLPMANHASFNAVQVVQGVIARTVGS